MAQKVEIETKVLALAAALVVFVVAPAQALTFASPFPDQQLALGFDVPAPADPELLMSTDLGNDFLAASVDEGSGAAVIFSLTECFLYAGASGCQADVPEGVPYDGITSWTVKEINIPVPAEGLWLFIGGMGNADTPGPDYALGSVQVLTDGGPFGGAPLPALDELLLTFGGGVDYVYYGTRITKVGDTLTFGYTVDAQLAAGTPIFFSNVARNVVPEPDTALLVAAGLALMARRRMHAAAFGPRRS